MKTIDTPRDSRAVSARRPRNEQALAIAAVATILLGGPMVGCLERPADLAAKAPTTPVAQSQGEQDLDSMLREAEELLAKRIPSTLLVSQERYEQAVALLEPGSPQAAEAWAGLADVSALIGLYAVKPALEVMPRASEAALNALELAPDRGRTHASLGLVRYLFDWDWPRAEQHLRRAIELDDSYGSAYHWLAMLLTASGRHPEAVATIEEALEVEPHSRIIAVKAATVFLAAGFIERAQNQLEIAISRDPDFALAHRELGYVLLAQDSPREAVAAMERASELARGSATTLAALALAYSEAGRLDEAREVRQQLEALDDGHRPVALHLAVAALATGDSERAAALVERAHSERDPGLVYLKSKPAFDPLRSHPRFRAVSGVGLREGRRPLECVGVA